MVSPLSHDLRARLGREFGENKPPPHPPLGRKARDCGLDQLAFANKRFISDQDEESPGCPRIKAPGVGGKNAGGIEKTTFESRSKGDTLQRQMAGSDRHD